METTWPQSLHHVLASTSQATRWPTTACTNTSTPSSVHASSIVEQVLTLWTSGSPAPSPSATSLRLLSLA
eukprot:2103281-Lingulodinium_polyedra.AAC.1